MQNSIIPAHPGWWAGTVRRPAEPLADDADPRRVMEAILLRTPVIAWAPISITMGNGGGSGTVLMPISAGFVVADRRVPAEGVLILPPRGIKSDPGEPLIAIWYGPRGERVEFDDEVRFADWLRAFAGLPARRPVAA